MCEGTYWAWARKVTGERVEIGSSIPENKLSAILARYSDPKTYKAVFYGRN